MTGLAIEFFFLYTCRFFLLSSNYTRRIKNSASSSNYPSGRKRFHRSKRCKGKSPLHGVPEKELKSRILYVFFFRQICNRSGLICYVAYSFDELNWKFLILTIFVKIICQIKVGVQSRNISTTETSSGLWKLFIE